MSIKTYLDITSDIEETVDVCIIGTGCGGATLGVRMAEAGKKVLFVERGGYYTKEDFDQREDNMIAKIDGGRGFDTSEDGSISLTYGNNVGGASVHYWADSYRTPEDRLDLWEKQYGLEGHGIKDLAPYWDQLEKDHNVHEPTETYYNRMNQLLREGSKKLGWKGHPIPQARKPCASSGYCMQGCSYDFKQSQLVTHIPRAIAAGAKVFADTNAVELVWQGTKATTLNCEVLDRATGLPNGKKVKIHAKVFVLAAGGYGSPAFLLKNGFKEKLPAVGEHTYCNPSPMVHALYNEEIIIYRNIPAAWGVDQFRLAKTENGKYVEGGYMLVANQLQPALFAAVLPAFGDAHRKLMTNFRKLGGTISWIDDVEEGRIEYKDGSPRYHVPIGGENEKRIRDSFEKQAIINFEMGANEVYFGDAKNTHITNKNQIKAAVAALDIKPGRFMFAAPHPAGGARMGKDPKTSVVGFDHRVHNTDNLYVSDPSVFPTAPSVDPSLTIMAFSEIAAKAVLSVV
ncbi:MAG: GMC family oxidoreductase [Bacteroidetes bacterium]|nr:GMC family oxidoreductase [Bacteroidota bacterium]